MEKTIWTPCLCGRYDFEVYLDTGFARDMIRSRIPIEKQTRMNELANEELKILKTNWLNPYTFYKDSFFITQFYIGQNGVWLSIDDQSIGDLLSEKESLKTIKYASHNIDTPKQFYILMTLFDKWVKYADTIKSI